MPTKQGDPLKEAKLLFNDFFPDSNGKESIGSITYTFYNKKTMKKFDKKATKWLEKRSK